MVIGKVHNIKNKYRKLLTDQNNIVIPTGELIKVKGIDLRIVACISAISNTDTCWEEGDNIRYCSYYKLNKNLNDMSELVGKRKSEFVRDLGKILDINSDELLESKRIIDEREINCIEIKYKRGGFVLVTYENFESLVKNLSSNAFKLYINLLWLCRNYENDAFVERQLNQGYLLELMGYSSKSDKTIRAAEKELIDLNLVKIRIAWETEIEFGKRGLTNPKTKKYYSIMDTI